MPRLQNTLLIAFFPITAAVLYLDSLQIAALTPYGQTLATGLALAWLLLVIAALPPKRRLALAIFVALAALGECLFSLVFALYDYRLGGIPLYVPLGHSILLGTALLWTDLDWIARYSAQVRVALALLHTALVLGALLLLHDTLSPLFSLIFLALVRRRCTEPFFLILGVLVLYVELLGTTWGCWLWRPDAFGRLHTTNPPMGAFTCYAAGEMFALYLAPKLQTGWETFKTNRLPPEESPAPA